MKRLIALVACILTFGFAFTACESNDGSNLTVKLTDAPITIDGKVVSAVNVTITRVDVVKKGSCALNLSGACDGEGVVTVFEGEKTINLLDYQDGVTAIIGEAALEAGDYLQFRMIVDVSKSNIVVDGETCVLKTPSGGECGIKIKGTGLHPLFTIEEGEDAELVFDFDAQLSITVNGNGEYVLKPVVKEVSYNNEVHFRATCENGTIVVDAGYSNNFSAEFMVAM